MTYTVYIVHVYIISHSSILLPLATAASKYLYIRVEHDIHFSSKTLSCLLFLCSNQNGSDIIPKPPLVAHKIFDDLRRLGGGRVAHDDHINIMYTLANYHLYSELVYIMCLSCDHINIMYTPPNYHLL